MTMKNSLKTWLLVAATGLWPLGIGYAEGTGPLNNWCSGASTGNESVPDEVDPQVSTAFVENVDPQVRATIQQLLELDSCTQCCGDASGCHWCSITCDDGHGCYQDCGTEPYCY